MGSSSQQRVRERGHSTPQASSPAAGTPHQALKATAQLPRLRTSPFQIAPLSPSGVTAAPSLHPAGVTQNLFLSTQCGDTELGINGHKKHEIISRVSDLSTHQEVKPGKFRARKIKNPYPLIQHAYKVKSWCPKSLNSALRRCQEE